MPGPTRTFSAEFNDKYMTIRINPTGEFQNWPKIDLHRHLPGAIRLETWWDIVNQHQVPLPTQDRAELHRQMTVRGQGDLKAFLRCFSVINLCFVDAAAIQRLTYEAIADAVAENIIYLELRFSPTRMAQNARISTAEALEAVIAGRDRAARDFGQIQVELIAGLSRGLGVPTCAVEAEIITTYAGRGIAGIDLLGNEADFPAAWFAPIFQPIARRGQLGITIHAGEAAGADSVRAAVELLGATRIGHGLRAEEAPDVVALLKARNITLEMCPTSNVQTGAAASLASHPLPRFLRNGLSVTINTDDPQVSQIDLNHEYEVSTAMWGLTGPELRQTLDYAVEAAFCTAPQKQTIKNKLTRSRNQ